MLTIHPLPGCGPEEYLISGVAGRENPNTFSTVQLNTFIGLFALFIYIRVLVILIAGGAFGCQRFSPEKLACLLKNNIYGLFSSQRHTHTYTQVYFFSSLFTSLRSSTLCERAYKREERHKVGSESTGLLLYP